jgi:glutamine amidotransferase
MIVAILDYGVGNLHSISKALAVHGARTRVERDVARATDADGLVLPGVGAFATAAGCLEPARDRLREAIARGLPTLGICLGMQLLFESSEEGDGRGLGVLGGRVTRLAAARLPQLGWNGVEWSPRDPFAPAGPREAYYANSFACRPADAAAVIAWSVHEADRFAAAVRRDACTGVQFHPEKSGAPGLRFLGAWLQSVRNRGSLPMTVSGGC